MLTMYRLQVCMCVYIYIYIYVPDIIHLPAHRGAAVATRRVREAHKRGSEHSAAHG